MPTRLLRAVGWSSAALLGLLGVAVFLLVLTPAKDAALPMRNKYGLVFDAGSTPCARRALTFPVLRQSPQAALVGRFPMARVRDLGLTGASTDRAVLGDVPASGQPRSLAGHGSLSLPAQLPQLPAEASCPSRVHPFPVREQNGTKAEQVFAEVAKVIGEYPVDFRGARILTGTEEGSFGWITVNYLLETLVKFSFAEKWEHPEDTEVLGALDLGGASTQITFQPGVPVEDRNTSVFFRLYGTNYSLYSHSYLCYGQTQALKMLLAALHQDSVTAQISHPCYPMGYQENVTVAELYDSPCVRAPSTASPAQVLTVTGTGDPARCITAVQKLFNFSCGAQRPCGFNGVYQPPVRGQFFAFSGFYRAFLLLNLTGGQSLASVNATIRQFCARTWDKVQKLFPTTSRTHLRDACAVNSYILTLLLQGYKFNQKTWLNIHFIRQVADVDVGWTLGYMLNLTNMIPSEPPPGVIVLQRKSWIAVAVLLAIMLILTFCLLTVMCLQRNSSGYERL
ncbi:ectonucleoside triphosphate diphosphohydrolase 8-like [Manacus vitellinus]|uniref:ectonucleoside triphosphate diphosphohydrolase 8-like n=1 Tax=Manacus vitellinus TaxID=328815 RepID=UPI00115DF3EA|nr:ectonucleoside triphosphate diphosphohydrolase 8-like [Manacus vitellinus]